MESSTPTTARPRRGAELELRIDSLAYGGAGVARTDGYVVFVRDAVPGDRVRALVTKSKRHYAEGRAVELLEPSPDRVAPARPPRRALAGPALRAPARGQGRAGRRRAAPDRPARRLRARADRARRRAVALPQQARVLVRRRRAGQLVCGFHAPGPLGPHRAGGRLPARLRARQRGARAGPGVVPRRGPVRLGPPHPRGPAAQPRRARGPAHRPDPGAARHLAGGAARRGPGRRGGLRRAAVDAGRRARRDDGRRRDPGALRTRVSRGGGLRPAPEDLPGGLLPDQHRDGRAPVQDRRRSTPACAAGRGCSTSTAASARSV